MTFTDAENQAEAQAAASFATVHNESAESSLSKSGKLSLIRRSSDEVFRYETVQSRVGEGWSFATCNRCGKADKLDAEGQRKTPSQMVGDHPQLAQMVWFRVSLVGPAGLDMKESRSPFGELLVFERFSGNVLFTVRRMIEDPYRAGSHFNHELANGILATTSQSPQRKSGANPRQEGCAWQSENGANPLVALFVFGLTILAARIIQFAVPRE